MENSQKIKKLSQVGEKVCNVIKILSIIGACCLFALSVIVFIITPTGIAADYLSKNPEIAKNITIGLGEKYPFISISSFKINLQKIIDIGYFDKTMYGFAAKCISYGIIFVLLAVLLKVVINMFKKFQECETPFDANILDDIKKAFIILIIIVSFYELYVGAIVGLVLFLFYFIYKRGIELQKESDETI